MAKPRIIIRLNGSVGELIVSLFLDKKSKATSLSESEIFKVTSSSQEQIADFGEQALNKFL